MLFTKKLRKKKADELFHLFHFGKVKEVLNWLKENPEKKEIVMEEYEFTPFLMACYFNEREVLDYLYQENVNIHYQDINGRNAVYVATLQNHDGLIKELHEKGVEVNVALENGTTALIYAACFDKKESVKELIKAGADVNFKNAHHQDLLHFVEKDQLSIEMNCLHEHRHLFHEENRKRLQKIRLKRLFEGGD